MRLFGAIVVAIAANDGAVGDSVCEDVEKEGDVFVAAIYRG